MLDSAESFRISTTLSRRPKWVEILKEALKLEKEKTGWYQEKGYGEFIGWEFHEVHVYPPTILFQMVGEKLLDITLSSRSGKHFRVRNPELVATAIKVLEEPIVEAPGEKVPEDLFSIITGYESIKSIVKLAVETKEPCHLLISGPPASAKTLFLMELSRLPDCYYVLAPTLTAAGLADLLFAQEPRFLLIDEIDRLSGENLGCLNSVMSTGIVAETKFRKTRTVVLTTKVFAAGIRINTLPRDLLSRFIKLQLDPYTQEQFTRVTSEVLTKREGIEVAIASKIADSVWQMWGTNSDVRQCIQIGRLVKEEPKKLDEVLRIIRRHGLKPQA